MTPNVSGHVRSYGDPRLDGAANATSEHGTTRAATGEGADLGELLGRAAAHFEGLAQVFGELQILGNQLAVRGERAVMRSSPAEAGGAPMQNRRRFLSAKAIADELGIDAHTVRRWRAEGKMPPAFTNGSVVRWPADVIDRWLAEGMEPGS